MKSKLTAEHVTEIQQRLAADPNLKSADLAREFGVDKSLISRIRSGQYWSKAAQEAAPPAEAPVMPPAAADPALRRIPLLCIARSHLNPRRTFDAASLDELADSIAAQGLLQNLVVRRDPDQDLYWIVAGERRWRALQLLANQERLPHDLQYEGIPCRVIEADDAEHIAIALLENLQRQDVNPMEEAEAFARLQALDPARWKPSAIAERIGMTPRHVQQRLALVTRLAAPCQQALRAGKITFSQARVLVSAPAERQGEVLKDIRLYPDATRLRAELVRNLIPVSRAIFDPADHPELAVIETDTGARYFADRAAFLTVQGAAAHARVKELAREWAWAEVQETRYFSDYGYDRSDDRSVAGAIVQFDSYSGEVLEQTGLVKKAAAADDAAKREAFRAETEARMAAELEFRAALAEHLAESPTDTIALWLTDRAMPGYGVTLSGKGLPVDLIADGPLRAVAGVVGPAEDGRQRWKSPHHAPAAFAALARLPEAKLATAVAGQLAAALPRHLAHDQLLPTLIALADRAGIPVPPHLRPPPAEPEQIDLEDAIHASDCARNNMPALPAGPCDCMATTN